MMPNAKVFMKNSIESNEVEAAGEGIILKLFGGKKGDTLTVLRLYFKQK